MKIYKIANNIVSSEYLASEVEMIHHTHDDIIEGDLLANIEVFSQWQLTTYNIDSLDLNEWHVYEDLVQKCIQEIQNNPNYPPVIIDDKSYGEPTIVDGTHRLNALSRLGYKTVKAYVPYVRTKRQTVNSSANEIGFYKIAHPLPLGQEPYSGGENSVNTMLTKEDIDALNRKYHFKKHLGGGAGGIAYETADGKVVKITTDPSEYQSSLELVRHKYDGFAEFYEAYSIKDSLYVIVKELVTPLSKAEQELFNHFFIKLDEDINRVPDSYLKKWPGLFEEFSDFIKKMDSYPQFDDTLNTNNMGRNSRGQLVAFDLFESELVEAVVKGTKIYKIAHPLPLGQEPLWYNGGEKRIDERLSEDDIKKLDEIYHFKRYLGGGSCGVAYEAVDGKVVKITSDESEYLACKELVHNGYDRFAKCYEAYKFSPSGLFVIIKEKVTPLGDIDKTALCILLDDEALNIDNVPQRWMDHIHVFEELLDFINDMKKVYPQYEDTLNVNNIGRNSDGRLVVFDLQMAFVSA